MKNTFLVLTAFTALMANKAQGCGPYRPDPDQIIQNTEMLDCEVEQVTGMFDSFLPPRVGDKITFDLSKPQLLLDFETGDVHRKSMIPGAPLDRVHPQRTQYHRAFFHSPAQPGVRVQAVVGAYGEFDEPLVKRSWTAVVQHLREWGFSEWALSEARLKCRLR